ncbi:kinetochore protein NDC80 homolog [Rhincodon typus]|uniref:kinetochore protein NDC80 homolog n=1 Tax=Rhincodon typus TaxID=259920 RepID=UPI00203045A9|nr:kinetochore protein NDC80 homolog [Rhincodon typus]
MKLLIAKYKWSAKGGKGVTECKTGVIILLKRRKWVCSAKANKTQQFLGEYGYPQPVSTKSLQSPSSKEFLKIFAFIYNLIDQSYQMPDSKFEEEIPRIFKSLGYPFPLSKSSMYTVGAPHTWPLILGALVWLMDNVKLINSIDPDKILFGADKDWDVVENVTDDGVHNNRVRNC